MTKNEILAKALALNGDDKKYQVTVEEDKIITRVKWMDATFFAPDTITDEVKTFEYIVKIHDNGKYSEVSKISETTKGLSGDGASYKKKGFIGKEITFDKTIGFGKNREDDSVGVINNTFYSEEYKKPVRDLLKESGCKKKMGQTGKIFLIGGIIAVVILIAATLLFLNLDDKVAINSEQFTTIAEEQGYIAVVDEDYLETNSDICEDLVIAVEPEESHQIEFYTFKDVSTAKDCYNFIKSEFEALDTKSSRAVQAKKYAWYKATTEDTYLYIAQVDKTFLYIDVDKEFKKDAEKLVEKIGY